MKDLHAGALAIAEVGRQNKLAPRIQDIHAFGHFFNAGELDRDNLDKRDGGCTRRELLVRALLLNAVLDQGPDIDGVREMMIAVINQLYENEIRIFHTPLDFFREINVSVDEIWRKHADVKKSRADEWARINQTTPGKYNLYMDGTRQTLNYAVFRWGVPLALPYLLDKQNDAAEKTAHTALLDYLETHSSAEKMSDALKTHETFGLGKAIGDKACHLFAKWIVSTFRLSRKKEKSWGEFSFEVPFDSNAGRVLWRTGYFLALASEEAFVKKLVIQRNMGKHGAHYIRVTNMRGMKLSQETPRELFALYQSVCTEHLRSHSRAPKTVEIQRYQHALLLHDNPSNFTPAEFDDGLIEIGRNYCFNHDKPKCEQCPINRHCEGYQGNRALIENYTT